MKTALIAGATGLVGSNLLNVLLTSEHYGKVISIGRREVDTKHPKLVQYIVDFEELDQLVVKADVFFCCLGTTIKKAGSQEAFRKVDFEFSKNLALYASKLGATSFHVISSLGASSKSTVFYNRVKGQMEEAIIDLHFKETHIYRPSLLLGKRVERRFGEGIGMNIFRILGFLFIGSLKNYKAIEANTVASFMLRSSLIGREGVFIHSSGKMH